MVEGRRRGGDEVGVDEGKEGFVSRRDENDASRSFSCPTMGLCTGDREEWETR